MELKENENKTEDVFQLRVVFAELEEFEMKMKRQDDSSGENIEKGKREKNGNDGDLDFDIHFFSLRISSNYRNS